MCFVLLVFTMASSDKLKDVILELYAMQGVKFGSYTLKYGMKTPIYVDLRITVSYPTVLDLVGELLWKAIDNDTVPCDLICGVPYGALPVATCLSVRQNIPMLFRRKEVKGYGTRKLLEGKYKTGDACVIIEDVIVSGQSIIETAEALRSSGLHVTDAVVFLDREQGGRQILQREGIKLHSVINLTILMEILHDEGKIGSKIVEEVKEFLAENQCLNIISNEVLTSKPKYRTYGERATLCHQPVAKELFTIIEEKRSNLAFAADVTSCSTFLKLVDEVGPYICLLKMHVELLRDFKHDFIEKLQCLSDKHRFLIYEDHKFSDIGSIVQHQYESGFYRIVDWAHITNAHPLPGPAVLNGLKKSGIPKKRACFLIAEMSSAGSLWTQDYVDFTLRMGELNDDFVIGFVCQSRLTSNLRLINIISGIKLQAGKDNLGQQYLTPFDAITKKGGDVIVVGRGIFESGNPADAARQYRDAAFAAYQSLL